MLCGNPTSPFQLVAKPEEADLYLLPYEWNYYLWHHSVKKACDFGREAERHGKEILVWFRGDWPPVVPMSNAVTFQSALYRSRLRPHQRAAPYFIPDPLPKYSGGRLVIRRKREKPVIGFCGYAEANLIKIAYGIYTNARHNFLHRLGRTRYEAVRVLPATLVRARALKLLARNTHLVANYRIRERAFKQRLRSAESLDVKSAVTEFFQNIYESDYILCVRGNGNWSIRFYEALACGRIPIFVDTDCVLPGGGRINWKDCCIWVEERNLGRIADIVSEFHASLTPEEFAARQWAVRRLWEEWLSLPGFMQHLSQVYGDRTERQVSFAEGTSVGL